jgi:hypothetical protein
MNLQHQLATTTCFGTMPFCALLPSGRFTFIGDGRKHHPNLRTRSVHTSGNVIVYCSPSTALAMSAHRTPIQNP